MAKIFLLQDDADELSYGFYCEGCKCSHWFRVRYKTFTRESVNRPPNIALWSWNGNFEKPTITPSIDCNRSSPELRCHSIVTDGMIHFLNDSYHDFKGRIIPLVDEDF